jgi:DNA-binding beta-propeller fold protein YncE
MKCGRSGSGDGELNRPSGVAVDNDGVIYVADWLNNRLQVFDTDGNFVTARTGDATISKWGKEKLDANAEMWGERQRAYGMEREKDFWGPTGVCVDNEDRVFVCESARNRIQVYQKLSPAFVGPRL